MRKVARGEMTTRNEVVLIVWGVGVSMKHSNHIKIIIFKPQKRKKTFVTLLSHPPFLANLAKGPDITLSPTSLV